MLLFVDTRLKVRRHREEERSLPRPRQRSGIWLVERMQTVRSGARWLDEVGNFDPITNAVAVASAVEQSSILKDQNCDRPNRQKTEI